MTICRNLKDKKGEIDSGRTKDGFTAVCIKQECLDKIGEKIGVKDQLDTNVAKYFQLRIGRQGKLLIGDNLIISKYQDL